MTAPHPAAQFRPADHPAAPVGRVGVLLVNLGTPDAATAPAVRRYLGEFLSDPRLIDYPRPLWLLVLNGIILNVRPAKTARNYAAIWNREADESPLRTYTRMQAESVRGAFGPKVIIDWAMRYGRPSIRERIDHLKAHGCDRILIVPLYPQYSATTTASVHDAVFAALNAAPWQPAVRFAPAFHDDEAYIAALKASAETFLSGLGWTPERVLLSFHGLPQRYFDRGDPYYCHCAKTARLLRAAMGWSEEFAPMTFQSKFGPGAWLSPATETTLQELAAGGVRRIAVMTPGFVADCIETLEEIAIRGHETFKESGGEQFAAVPCLNATPPAIELLRTLIAREAAGWINDGPRP